MAEARELRTPETPDEELLGAEQPVVRTQETDDQRVARMQEELRAGFAALRDVRCGVSIFGSARTTPDRPEYQLARQIARRLGEEGFDVITGGGPGIMEAANRGARQAGAHSIGLNIDLPFEQDANPYQDLPLEFHYFFTRKVMFVRYATAFVVFPGGFGTLDELFEALVLIQTGKIRHFPILLVGSSFWAGLLHWVREQLAANALISAGDLDLVTVTDDPEEIVRLIRRGAREQGRLAA